MERVLQTAHQIATTDLPVLIEEETGTGKDLYSVRFASPILAQYMNATISTTPK
jgi:transcriptional regulator with AAA-type ATPase domain